MAWRTVEIITLAAIQTVIVNVLLLGPLAFRPALHWLLLAASFAVGLVLLKQSKGARCVTMLLVPQFLSKRGRAVLIGYIFLLTITGPTANTMVNVEVLGETLSCSQEQLKAAIRDTISALKVPFLAMKKIIDELLKTVERSFMKVQRIMMEMLKLVKRILHSIKKAYEWLRDIVSVCNDKLGTPSERCLHALDQAIDGCKEEMGAMDFLCEVTQVAKTVCYGAKMVDYFCELIDFISDAVVEEIEQGVSGEGILADTLRDIVRSFEPIVNGTAIDPAECIPNASTPRFARYGQIVALLALCWCFAFLEPYGLRVRQLVMRRYYPARARARAIWLYGDILLKRESLLKMLRLQIAGTSRERKQQEAVSWIDVVRAKTNRYWICRMVLGRGETVRCILCGDALNERDDPHIRCSRPECPGLYCQDCLLETGNNCSLCMDLLVSERCGLDEIYLE
uniref:E3 ubiquitin-protein ligase DCST1-like C-terminal domain-containing protein n=1 Tax=Anopheles merus TaxID=30066 RepID=A0A182UUY4_ANOME